MRMTLAKRCDVKFDNTFWVTILSACPMNGCRGVYISNLQRQQSQAGFMSPAHVVMTKR